MMSDVRDLYQEVILDHNKNPRNFFGVSPHTHAADGHNPLCGDQLRLELRMGADGRIEAIGFTGRGCAISTASASIMVEGMQGLTASEALERCRQFRALLTDTPETADLKLGKLTVLAGVRDYPMRVKCATLAWHTLEAALEGDGEVSTE